MSESDLDTALVPVRREIDEVDYKILSLLAERQGLVEKVMTVKARYGGQIRQPARFRELLEKLLDDADKLALNKELVEKIWNNIHESSIRQQQKIKDEPK